MLKTIIHKTSELIVSDEDFVINYRENDVQYILLRNEKTSVGIDFIHKTFIKTTWNGDVIDMGNCY